MARENKGKEMTEAQINLTNKIQTLAGAIEAIAKAVDAADKYLGKSQERVSIIGMAQNLVGQLRDAKTDAEAEA